MRKEIVTGLIGTVGGGVILWMLEPYKELFPKWAESFFDYLWAPVAFPRVTTWIIALLFGFLLFDFWFTYRARKKQEATARRTADYTPPTMIRKVKVGGHDTMPPQKVEAAELDEDEEAILAALTKFSPHAEESKLRRAVNLSDFRFDRALGSLRSKFFVATSGAYASGNTVSFKQDGRNYAALHRLDRR
jgi:hypothetical protein